MSNQEVQDSKEIVFETRGSGKVPASVFGITSIIAILSPAFFWFLGPLLVPSSILSPINDFVFDFYGSIFGFWIFTIFSLTAISCLVFLNKLQVTEEGVSYKVLGNETWSVDYDDIRSVDNKEELIHNGNLKLNGEFGSKRASVRDVESAASFIYDRV